MWEKMIYVCIDKTKHPDPKQNTEGARSKVSTNEEIMPMTI